MPLADAVAHAGVPFAHAVPGAKPSLADAVAHADTERQLDSCCSRGVGHGGEL
jgi:hypothetical protein